MALAAVTNGGWWLLWSRKKLGSAGVGSATAQVETGMRRAAAVVGGCYGANRGSGSGSSGQRTAAAEAEKLEWLRASLWEGEYEMTK